LKLKRRIIFFFLGNKEAGEPVLEQSSYSDLVDKYYLDTNLCCDVMTFEKILRKKIFRFRFPFSKNSLVNKMILVKLEVTP
jgi:hypothetical protein